MNDMKLIVPSELSGDLGVPEATLAQWRYLGIGPAYHKVGRFVRYLEQDVEVWLERQRRGGDLNGAA